MGHHLWGAEDRPRQAARVQGQRRDEADRRIRPDLQAAQGDVCAGEGVVRECETVVDRAVEWWTRDARLRARNHRHRLASGDGPRSLDRQPAPARFDERARSARRPEISPGRRRRLYRPGARLSLRGARQQSDRRRDDARASAWRRSRSCRLSQPAAGAAAPQDPAQRPRRRDEGRQERRDREGRRRRTGGRRQEPDVRSRAGIGRPEAELGNRGAGQNPRETRAARLH